MNIIKPILVYSYLVWFPCCQRMSFSELIQFLKCRLSMKKRTKPVLRLNWPFSLYFRKYLYFKAGLYWICLVLPEFCGSVIIQMKLEYPWGQLANVDQILYEASLGWGKVCIRFWDRLDQNPGFHGNRKRPLTYNGENDVSTFSRLFLIRFFLYLQVTRTCIRSRMSSNFGQIGPLTLELAALERLKNFPWTYNGKMVSPS